MGMLEIGARIYSKTKGGKQTMDVMRKVMAALEGKKTYLMIAGVVLTEALFLAGVIPPESRESLIKVFGVGAAAGFAAKVNRGVKIIKNLGTDGTREPRG
jgi:hypothetical protein